MTPFDLTRPHVRVRFYARGASGDRYGWAALDTAATRTVIRPSFLRRAGCDLRRPVGFAEMTAATGLATAPLVRVERVVCLGADRVAFPVVAHELPAAFDGDGLVGLDFLAGRVLTLDFARGRVALRPSRRRWWPFGR